MARNQEQFIHSGLKKVWLTVCEALVIVLLLLFTFWHWIHIVKNMCTDLKHFSERV